MFRIRTFCTGRRRARPRYGGAVVPGLYRDLFTAVAATAGSLTGLLFAVLSVTPSRGVFLRRPTCLSGKLSISR